MASTACFLHHHAGAALSTQNRSSSSSNRYLKPTWLICREQNQAALSVEDGTDIMSRRLDLAVWAATIGSKVSPADTAYGESDAFISNTTRYPYTIRCHAQETKPRPPFSYTWRHSPDAVSQSSSTPRLRS
ncbi:unnamed protein product [Fraxinus pennsylvanica]|uniref:Uncharacterized protein n=1 Tax=Fraxinus pennsylvanica TaxID=56036 RepID=A0AAD2AE19_9LAMI|nr:unnamed protein product [Fraxinus pennsylvanica]